MSKRSNGEGSSRWVVRNGIKYWCITISDGYDPLTGDAKRKSFYGKTQAEAKSKYKAYLETVAANSDNSTLGSFFYDWLWNIKKVEFKDSTFDRLEGIYRNYIKNNKKLYNAKLIDIDPLYLQKVTNKLLETHTLSQVRNLNRAIGNCFKYAVSISKVKINPVTSIIYPKNHNVVDEKKDYISEEQQKKLVNIIKGDALEGVILLGLTCGMRLGEILALTVNDIDFDNRIIKINKSVKHCWNGAYSKDNKRIYENKVTIPKTKKSIREVPFPASLVPILKNYITKNKEKKLKYGEMYFDNNLIFCKENGDYLDDKQPNRRLKSALKKAGIDSDLHFHSLRHIFITNCISKDINIKTVMDWAGHTDISITMNIYAEVNKDKNLKEYEKINEMFL